MLRESTHSQPQWRWLVSNEQCECVGADLEETDSMIVRSTAHIFVVHLNQGKGRKRGRMRRRGRERGREIERERERERERGGGGCRGCELQ